MTNATPTRASAASLVAVLALAQALLAMLRALGGFQIGSDLLGRGVLILPIIADLAFFRGALIAGIALLYAFFAWGVLKDSPWARTVGLIAAAVNLLLVSSALVEGEWILRDLFWCIVPVSVVCYLLAQPRASST